MQDTRIFLGADFMEHDFKVSNLSLSLQNTTESLKKRVMYSKTGSEIPKSVSNRPWYGGKAYERDYARPLPLS